MEVSLTLMPAPDVLVAMVMYSAVKRPVQPSAAPTQSLLQENVVQYVPVVSEVFLLRVVKDVHLFTFYEWLELHSSLVLQLKCNVSWDLFIEV